ncbi:MAG: hypothetical protein KDC24_03795, partial [Saprospiraceae bacterium]|nr:hypothetical protein [Saprospiraceae bacterium]
MKYFLPLICLVLVSNLTVLAQDHSVARQWNEELLESIRNDFARPTVHARNLFHTSIAMYDAWAAYDTVATTYLLGKTVGGYFCPFNGVPAPADLQAAREEAVSFAAYRLLRYRFRNSPGFARLLPNYNDLMADLGYDINFTGTDYSTGNPAALGNYIANCIISFGLQDGSNEQANYGNRFYSPVNPPLVTDLPGNPDLVDPNRWQPLTLDVFIDQSGNVIPFNTPTFLSPEWGEVVPFALKEEDKTVYNRNGNDYYVFHDPGMPPQMDPVNGGPSTDLYIWAFSMVSIWQSHLDATDTTTWDISPAGIGNNPPLPTSFDEYDQFYKYTEGGDQSRGWDENPVTGQPYTPQMVRRGDYARVLAEFWADGPDSETPPGHWFTLINYVHDHPMFERRWRGQGPIIEDLEWDVKAYLMLGGAMHDAAVASWGVKGWYDYLRPISAIRGMAEKGQSSDPNLPNYSQGGIKLIPGYIELVEAGDPLVGNNNQHLNKIKLYTWRGHDYISNPAIDEAGVGWILAENWWPYQRPSFVTPPFAGYVSGHSTYSRTAADVLTELTGSPFFPGGMGIFDAVKNEFLVFEEGPSETIELQWATYQDASDQCSLSRIWGGIHPPVDDMPGRHMGMAIAKDAVALAESYFFKDSDQDGYYNYVDCDDNDPDSYPDAPEICDGKDNNCDGNIDEGLTTYTYYLDIDQDGFGDALQAIDTCLSAAPAGFVSNNLDCDDQNNGIHPNITEVCDGIDNDCNGMVDDGLTIYTYFKDVDGDGFGDAAGVLDTCLAAAPAGYVTNAMDCNDQNGAINPNGTEICDGIDNDCNGLADDGLTVFTYYLDSDNDGFGDANNYIDTCLSSPLAGYVTNQNDCNDADQVINPNGVEICDGIDNDCNGLADDGLTVFTYYPDTDNDGFGNPDFPMDTCLTTAPIGYVDRKGDCNDADASINPDVLDIADNGIDEDCSGLDYYEATKI